MTTMCQNGVSTSEAKQNGTAEDHCKLSINTVNPLVKKAEYAVRGEVIIRAQEIEEDMRSGERHYDFDKLVYCNIGNPQAIGQQPITFFRQMLALTDYPQLLETRLADEVFPPDVLERARSVLKAIPAGTGAYSHSQGAPILRQHIAEGIERRDGYPCNPNDLYLTDGASPAVHTIMKLVLRDEKDAILTPIPQYPLYSATIALYGGTLAPYYLNEADEWGMDVNHLREQTRKARAEGLCVRALVVINPGNPTGQVLSEDNQREVLLFCAEEGVALLADEVYQDNIYAPGKSFTSFKKVLCSMGGEVAASVPLFSFHSVSKGFYGECGRRGGYMEVVNVPKEVHAQIYKMVSINLCSNLNGQLLMSLVMKPPQEGEPSYPLYASERDGLLASLKRRAEKLSDTLNKLEGVTCNHVQGALYAFPQIQLPRTALEAAEAAGRSPDSLYVMELLENTGIVCVPGSGFQQEPGTFHFRTTILPPESDMDTVAERLSDFHADFMRRFKAGSL